MRRLSASRNAQEVSISRTRASRAAFPAQPVSSVPKRLWSSLRPALQVITAQQALLPRPAHEQQQRQVQMITKESPAQLVLIIQSSTEPKKRTVFHALQASTVHLLWVKAWSFQLARVQLATTALQDRALKTPRDSTRWATAKLAGALLDITVLKVPTLHYPASLASIRQLVSLNAHPARLVSTAQGTPPHWTNWTHQLPWTAALGTSALRALQYLNQAMRCAQ
jgi:hypothetical protein